ncbi:MAG: DUF72 domain-containing protein [Candidatus Dormibacteraeota bacterium]|nr:DUF72 domain-containing protein [Candidatus Dormibacteraeota bacterium]
MPLHIGTSGWQYAHWRNTFYPRGVPQPRWLEFYAQRFDTVELNNSFYMLPKEESFTSWALRTPPGFVFAVKISRYLTHVKRLSEPEEPVQRFLDRARALGTKLGPILLQLPPNMPEAVGLLDTTLDLFPDGSRVAVECRHHSWYTDALRRSLEAHNAALVLADSPQRLTPRWRTADWAYVRFHEGVARPRPCYSRRALGAWAAEIAELWSAESDVFVYFNNDPRACAIRDATVFSGLMSRLGFAHGSVPRRGEVTVGDRATAAWAAPRR